MCPSAGTIALTCRLLLILVTLCVASAAPFAAQRPQSTAPADSSAVDPSFLNLGRATVVTAATLGPQERTAISVLSEEID
jgi:hypothetical protein